MQRLDRIASASGTALLAASVLLGHFLLSGSPNRTERGARRAELTLTLAGLDAGAFAPLRLLAAYRVNSSDPRFGGISGLAVDGRQLVALTDSGVVARFAKPSGVGTVQAAIFELPGGPGPSAFKSNRDSEALAADQRDAGWWVAFENRNELWLYDRAFKRALRRVSLDGHDWAGNRGVEGLAVVGQSHWLFPEEGAYALRLGNGMSRRVLLPGLGGRFPWQGWIAEAAALPGGSIIVAERRLRPSGFANSLVLIEPAGSGLKVGQRYRLPVGAMDNIEAIAVETAPAGALRLWLMSDNDRGRTQTLLMLVELPAGWRSAAVRPRRPRSPS